MTKFLFPLLGLATGIYVSADLFPGLLMPSLCIVLGVVIWFLITRLSKDPIKGKVLSPFHSLWIFLLFAGIGAINFHLFCAPKTDREIAGNLLCFQGKITDVKTLAEGDRFKINVQSIKNKEGQIYKISNINLLLKTDG